jgi:hypothetical protein
LPTCSFPLRHGHCFVNSLSLWRFLFSFTRINVLMTHRQQANGVGKRHLPCVNKVPKQTNKQTSLNKRKKQVWSTASTHIPKEAEYE